MTIIENGLTASRANAKLTLERDFAALDRASLRLFAAPVALTRRVLGTLAAWRQRSLERRQLLTMTNRDLRDIGLTQLDARMLAEKPFWQS